MVTPGSDRVHPVILVVGALVAVVLGVVAMGFAQFYLARTLGLRPALLVSEVLLAMPAMGMVLAMGGPVAERLGLRAMGRRTVLLSLAAGATLWGLSLGLFEVQYVFWRPDPRYIEAFRQLHAALKPSGPIDALYSVLAIAIGPAVCEELLVRGVVLPSVARPLGMPAAVAVSAVVFGLIHLDLYRLAFTIVAGIVLGLLRVSTGSLLAPMVAHATLNTITLVTAALFDDPAKDLPDPQPLLGTAILLGGTAATAFVLNLMRVRGSESR
jgi:membrane protease YdiL (CAAX protease family)